jgi:hypothetical protein
MRLTTRRIVDVMFVLSRIPLEQTLFPTGLLLAIRKHRKFQTKSRMNNCAVTPPTDIERATRTIKSNLRAWSIHGCVPSLP